MAHLIRLHQLTYDGDANKIYTPILFNLDTMVSVEPSPSGIHSMITTRWNSNGIRVKETLDEILKLSQPCCNDGKASSVQQLNG